MTQSWTERETPDPVLVKRATGKASEIISLTASVFDDLPMRHIPALRQAHADLKGKTVSDGGLFAMMDRATPQMVGEGEAKWLVRAAQFCDALINALMDRELTDNSPPTDEQRQKIPEKAQRTYYELNQTRLAIREAFPPAQHTRP